MFQSSLLGGSDTSVQGTNDDAQVSKLSCVKAGYFQDEFTPLFVRRAVRRSPLINRGYYARHAGLQQLLDQFLLLGSSTCSSNNDQTSNPSNAGDTPSTSSLQHADNADPIHASRSMAHPIQGSPGLNDGLAQREGSAPCGAKLLASTSQPSAYPHSWQDCQRDTPLLESTHPGTQQQQQQPQPQRRQPGEEQQQKEQQQQRTALPSLTQQQLPPTHHDGFAVPAPRHRSSTCSAPPPPPLHSTIIRTPSHDPHPVHSTGFPNRASSPAAGPSTAKPPRTSHAAASGAEQQQQQHQQQHPQARRRPTSHPAPDQQHPSPLILHTERAPHASGSAAAPAAAAAAASSEAEHTGPSDAQQRSPESHPGVVQHHQTRGKTLQVLVLGAGFDTAWFQLQREGRAPARYLELDFKEVTRKKAAIIAAKPALLSALLLQPDEILDPVAGEVVTQRYTLMPVDLRDLDAVKGALQRAGFDRTTPTYILSECVLVYMEPAEASQLVTWLGEYFSNAAMVVYEQVNPNDAFGRQMVSNLESRGCPLRGLAATPTLAAHQQRFTSNGWQRATSLDLDTLYSSYLDPKDKARIERLEIFDEFEEWHLIQSHYALTIGIQDAAGLLNGFGFQEQPQIPRLIGDNLWHDAPTEGPIGSGNLSLM
ncbi:MAG: hypothetical protein WDW36_000945 [Sanguina aurantia]